MIKKFICTLLCIACVFTSASSMFASAEEATKTETQTVLKDSDEEALLTFLGVKSNNTLDLNEKITRGEFAAMLAPVVNYWAVKDNISFDDVPEEHEFFEGISDVGGAYVMTGTGESVFSPDGELTYEHALIAIVRMLGIESMAKSFGAGITGGKKALKYIGLELKLLDKTVMTRHMAYDLIYDALFTNTVSYLPNQEILRNEETFLKKNLDIVSVSGQLTDNGITGLSSLSGVGNGRIVLGDTVMQCAAVGIEEYLGYLLDCYVRVTEDECTLVSYTPSDRNELVEFYTEDYISSNETTIVFETDTRQKSLNLPKSMTVIYNGKYDPTFLKSDFKNVNGRISFLKTAGSSEYDIVFVHDIEVFVVSRTNANKVSITSDTDEQIFLDEEEYDVDVFYYYNGAPADFSKITADDVLMIEKSRDKTLYKIYISDTEITGIVAASDEEGVVIEDKYYEYSDYYLKKLTAMEYVEPGMGKTNLIYLDYNGKVAKVNARVLRDLYAWLERIYYSPDDEKCYIKIFDEFGKMQNTVLNEKVVLNGLLVEDSVAGTSPLVRSEDSTKRQLITYKQNADGEITEINTAADMTAVENYKGYTEGEFTYDYYSARSAFRAGAFSCFDFRKYFINSSVTVFIIPTEESAGDDKFSIQTGKYFQNNTNYNGINVYDAQENTVPNVIVMYTSTEEAISDVQDGSSICIFKDVTLKVNDDDEVSLVMRAYDSSGEIELETEDENVCDTDGAYYPQIKNEDGTTQENKYLGMKLKDLPEGALIQYALNAYGKISDIRILHIEGVTPYETWTMTRGSSSSSTIRDTVMNYVNNHYFQMGIVEKMYSGILVYSINGTKYPISHSDTRTVVIYDKSEKNKHKVFLGTGADIEPGDKLFIKTAWANLSMMFCIKE